MKGSLNETQPAASRGFSLRSMLLLVLLVGVGAGATAHVVGSAFAVARSHEAEAASVVSRPSKILWQKIPELGAQRRKRLRNLETPKILIG